MSVRQELNQKEIIFPSCKIVRRGFIQAMNGNELWVNTESGEMVKIVVHDENLLRKLYCTHVKITIEPLNDEQV
jgi:hypothetical protein